MIGESAESPSRGSVKLAKTIDIDKALFKLYLRWIPTGCSEREIGDPMPARLGVGAAAGAADDLPRSDNENDYLETLAVQADLRGMVESTRKRGAR